MTVWLIRRKRAVGIRTPGDRAYISEFLLVPKSSGRFEWETLPDDKDLRGFVVEDTKAEAEKYLIDLLFKIWHEDNYGKVEMWDWDVYGLKVKA